MYCSHSVTDSHRHNVVVEAVPAIRGQSLHLQWYFLALLRCIRTGLAEVYRILDYLHKTADFDMVEGDILEEGMAEATDILEKGNCFEAGSRPEGGSLGVAVRPNRRTLETCFKIRKGRDSRGRVSASSVNNG